MAQLATNISVLIVDDEREACANLQNILRDYLQDGINVVGIAHNTREAEKKIDSLAPDAVFLDIEMPNENAFHFLERISPVNFEVIFVTAYDEYAIKAFRLNAVDYILKPISIAELSLAIQKLREKLSIKKLLNHNSGYAELASQLHSRNKTQRITLKDNNVIEVVDFKDVFFVEAQGSYIRVIFLKDGAVKDITMSGSLSDYEELLPADMFFRIHKSYLINCFHVKKIVKGDFNSIIVHSQFNLPISRRRYATLIDFLKTHNFYDE